MKGFIVLSMIIAMATQALSSNILCYYEGWVKQQGDGSFPAYEIPATKCTHIVYSFILPASGGSIQDFNDGDTLQQLVDLKNENGELQIMAAIGGWNAGSTTFSEIVSNKNERQNFVNALSNFIDQYNLDGIDIDWEYPAQRGGSDSDKENFITFLSELRLKLGSTKVITAAVGAGLDFIDSSYDVKGMDQYLSFINLMTYDMHGAYDSQTGQNSPLYASSASDISLNADATVTAWINAGASPAKLNLGLGFYGHNFQLVNDAENGVGAPASGPGEAGPFTQQAGYKSYLEICMDLMDGGWTTVYDNQQQCPYSYNGNQWVGYDNVESITVKSQYAIDRGLGGVMMWAIDHDDLYDVCGGGSTPLLNAINSVIRN